jgi:hypothetical protein
MADKTRAPPERVKLIIFGGHERTLSDDTVMGLNVEAEYKGVDFLDHLVALLDREAETEARYRRYLRGRAE